MEQLDDLAITALQYFFLAGVPLLALLGMMDEQAKKEAEPNCLQRADRYLDELEKEKQA